MQRTPSDLRSLKFKFSVWRKNKPNIRTPIPANLWQEAAKLCEKYSVSTISRALKLDHKKLKEKVRTKKVEMVPEPEFVSVALPIPEISDPICEWVRPDGTRLRIRIQGGSIDQVVQSFLGGRV
jgi:hypothetical protein